MIQKTHSAIITTTKRIVIAAVVTVELFISPAIMTSLSRVSAEENTSGITSESSGEDAPTGADSGTYHYNEATGLWENDHYIWNPATKQTTPKDKPSYSWNPVTKRWDTTKWIYDAPSGRYVPNVIEVAGTTSPDGLAAPSISNTGPGSNNTVNDGGTITGTGPDSYNQTDGGGSISNTGPNSNNQTGLHSSSDGTFDGYFNATISNNVAADAETGDLVLAGNTTVGNGASGDASSIANVLNMLQSSWNPAGNVKTFSVDIDGDVYGDMFIDPAQLQGKLGGVDNNDSSLTINTTEKAKMENNIDVNATTGDVDVSRNTTAGNATSGSAQAIANVVNLINSAIASGDSFVGNININGNFDGDILLPPETLQALLASNVPRTTINTAQLANSSTTATNNTSQAIANDTTATATSGAVNATANTSLGNATSGNAGTNITVLNLTGQQVVGKNAMLVFVNVMGQWVGMIVNAPEGSTAAALTDDSAAVATSSGSTAIASTTDHQIKNKINATAQSGDVDVNRNTKAGDATSGNAKAGVNVANVSNSAFSLSDWFGILFINVFGSWHGSFGVNTLAGQDRDAAAPAPAVANAAVAPQVFAFVPTAVGTAFRTTDTAVSPSNQVVDAAQDKGVVLAAKVGPKQPPANIGSQGSQNGFNFKSMLPVGILALAAAGASELVARLRARRS